MDKGLEERLWILERFAKDMYPRSLNIGFCGDKRGLTPVTGLTLAQWIIGHQHMIDQVHIMSDEGGNQSIFDMVDLHAHHADVYAYPPKKVAMHFPMSKVQPANNPLRQHDAIVDACEVLIVATDRKWPEFEQDLCWRAARRAEKQGKTVICIYPQGVIGPEPWKFEVPEQAAPDPSLIAKAIKIAKEEEE
jgi:hypothetical protein